ncbi:MAG TPA: 4Fe-4S binding protein [Spirochaetia bacterium]|nr:4Fe-4S binding protein [Spirochaetia bacterium]
MTGVFLCTCQMKNAAVWAGRVEKAMPGVPIFSHQELCSGKGTRFAAARVKQRKLDKVLLAGCAALQSKAYVARFAASAGLAQGAIDSIRIFPSASTTDAARAIQRAAAGRGLVPVFKTRRVALQQGVLVVGGGRAGWETARLAASLGYPTTVIRKEMEPARDPASGIETLPGTTLVSLTGSTGHFSARLSQNGTAGAHASVGVRDFGAVVIAEDDWTEVDAPSLQGGPLVAGRVVLLAELERLLEGLPQRERPRHVVIVLDYRVDEGTAAFESALRTAISVRERWKPQVEIALRDARVAAYGLEALYDRASASGATFMKHDGALKIHASASRPGVTLRFHDAALSEDVELSCDVAAISAAGLAQRREDALAVATGISQDGYGTLQENNVHLLPTGSNREGVFVVAPGYEQDAAFSIHALLSHGTISVELSHAVVDGDKCVLCLTCVRSCPFKAMRIDEKEKKAECIPESCRRCGICEGECPARAITLPAWSDEILMAMAGASR